MIKIFIGHEDVNQIRQIKGRIWKSFWNKNYEKFSNTLLTKREQSELEKKDKRWKETTLKGTKERQSHKNWKLERLATVPKIIKKNIKVFYSQKSLFWFRGNLI